MHSHVTRARRVAAVLAAVFLATAGLLVATPASAHDELASSDPVADSTVAVLPAALTLTFSGDLLGDAGATQVQVTDAAGTSLVAGAPVVQANVVTQPLTSGATGAIMVLWRTASGDGHPVSGQFGFTVAGAPAPTPGSSTTAPPTTAPATTAPTIAASPTAVPATSDSGSTGLPWILLAVLGVVVLGGVVYLLASRARRVKQRETARADGSSAGPPPPGEPGSEDSSAR